MSFFDQEQFDASKIEPANFEALPPGDYACLIEKAEEKPTRDRLGSLLSVRLKVVDGKYKGRVLFSNINLKNKSSTAQAIGHGQLSALCRATGIMRPKAAFELCNKTIKVTLKVVPNQSGSGMVNNVSAYHPLSEAVAVDQAAPVAESGQLGAEPPWA